MLAVGAIFLIEALDDTIKSPEEISRHLGLPVLGAILKHDHDGDLISSGAPRSPTAEAFRSLRTNIQYASVDYPIRTLLVTSPSAGVGKSTLVANLGTVLAQSDIRTILVEADMRRPKLHQYLKAHNRFGLSSLFVSSSLLKTMGDVSDMVQTTSMEKMSLLASGKTPPNPSELLASEKMSNLLATLQENSTIVIVDSPPVIAVTDATVLAPRMDAVLLVVKPGETKLEAARQTVEQLRRVGANLVGVVLNGVDPRSSRYGYYYRYDREYYHEDEQELVGMPAWQRWGLAGLGLFLALLIGGIALWTSPNAAFGAWLGGKPTASPTAVAETPIAEAASEVASATPTLTPEEMQAATSEPVSEPQASSTPQSSPTPISSPTITLTPTPGPGFLTPFGTEQTYLLHQVKFGDNLPNLAEQYETERDVIVAANGLIPDVSLQPDQVIVIMPGQTDSLDVPEFSVIFLEEATPIDDFASLRGLTPEEVRQYNQLGPGDVIPGGRWLIFPERQVTPTVAATAIPTPDLSMALTEPFGPEDQLVLHQVSVGESVPVLEDIYVTTARTIRAINDIDGSIQVGDVLVIMPDRQSPGEMPQFSVYRVQENITVETLATELDIPADDLTYYNDLEAGQEIQAGRWLIYPTPADLSEALTEPFGPEGAYVLHQIAIGESVPVLVDRYKTSSDVIYAVNEIKGSIQPGDVLVMLPDQIEVGDTPRFSVFWVQEETDVNALAAELGVLPEDLTYYNSLEADQPITLGQWIIYPAPEDE
jgi:capsular exopolysaccharide synthesis family protein